MCTGKWDKFVNVISFPPTYFLNNFFGCKLRKKVLSWKRSELDSSFAVLKKTFAAGSEETGPCGRGKVFRGTGKVYSR